MKRGQHRKSLDKLFQGFKPAVESCYFSWEAAYPLEGITFCSADRKSSGFCWSRAVQLQRGPRAALADAFDSGAAARAEGFPADYKGRGGAYSSQQEVAVRPKETKRKALSLGSGGGVLVRLGGSVSLTLEDTGAKCMYKGPSASFGGKMKLPPGGAKGSSAGGPGGGGPVAAGKHGGAKRRTSSEDSSLEPDLAELSLDDGSSLALGAEASNTFDLLPPAAEMLPSLSPSLSPSLRDSQDHGCNGGVSKGCEAHHGGHPPGFLSREAAGAEPELEVASAGSGEQDVDPTSPAGSCTSQKMAKPEQDYGQLAADPGAEAGPAGSRPGAAAAAAAEEGGPDAVEEEEEEEVVGEDDYQAYYVGVASEEGMERQMADSLHQEEEPDIFAGLKPLEQESRMEVRNTPASHFWPPVQMCPRAGACCALHTRSCSPVLRPFTLTATARKRAGWQWSWPETC